MCTMALAATDASIILTNSITTDNVLRGGRLRMHNSDLRLYNYETNGKIEFVTGFMSRVTIDKDGNVGIGSTSPTAKLQIQETADVQSMKIIHSGNNTQAMSIAMSGSNNITGIHIANQNNPSPSEYVIGIHAVVGNGGSTFLSPTSCVGLIGENRSSSGSGVMGTTYSSSGIAGGVNGTNFSSSGETYGVTGGSFGTTGAGVYGFTAGGGTAGVMGYSNYTGAALKGRCGVANTTGIALELDNGTIRSTGARKPVFNIVAQSGVNISGNLLHIPASGLANSATDLLIVTPVFGSAGVYITKAIGVWWNGSNWTIFIQDQTSMPAGAEFNVLVVKQ